MTLERVFTPALGHHMSALGRDVFLRPGTSDRQVWSDTFTGLYHVPPDSMPAPRTVLDLGASIGLTTAHYQELWRDAYIHALEPNWDSFEVAWKNVCWPRGWPRGSGETGLRWLAAASWSGPGWYDPAAPADATAIRADVRPARPARGGLHDREERYAEVWCVTLAELLKAYGRIDFCKMDIEGMEWGLFEHGSEWAPLVRHLLVELHQEPGCPIGGADVSGALVRRAISSLEAVGFRAERHGPHPQAVFAARR